MLEKRQNLRFFDIFRDILDKSKGNVDQICAKVVPKGLVKEELKDRIILNFILKDHRAFCYCAS